ncbi:SRPBCC family protein [Kibdelosporangium phytohabitans]|uniref:Polyketide cyclase n=1 Tax=Kibdelosporangium phytohabitans TaxID=860235 RepID=A0A0N9IBM7_9PSEU|nr:SRPBCC family protein [Kibdelosporangium phytohabitans]ALG12100.1 polyketide cyclase [Kibdelosporangium phytohabitans]MBE1463595.1 carbon monoxide dehydrogenase subunit G [Kibdelosporangium phytohabitans]
MVHVERTLTVGVPAAVVAGYLADFGNAEEWDPGTVSCTRTDEGELAPGARWRNISEFRGKRTELTYELTRRDLGRITFVGNNKTATSTDDFTIVEGEESTTVHYAATIVFHGLAKLADPFLKRHFERLGDEVVVTLTAALEKRG